MMSSFLPFAATSTKVRCGPLTVESTLNRIESSHVAAAFAPNNADFRRFILKRSLSIAMVTLVCLASIADAAQTVTGKVTKVRDADTVVVKGVPIRLNGVDAPENGTQAGNQATAAMKRYLRGKTLMPVWKRKDAQYCCESCRKMEARERRAAWLQ